MWQSTGLDDGGSTVTAPSSNTKKTRPVRRTLMSKQARTPAACRWSTGKRGSTTESAGKANPMMAMPACAGAIGRRRPSARAERRIQAAAGQGGQRLPYVCEMDGDVTGVPFADRRRKRVADGADERRQPGNDRRECGPRRRGIDSARKGHGGRNDRQYALGQTCLE